MSHTDWCKMSSPLAHADTRCDCFEPDTDWSPELPCGGIATSVNGGPMSEPPWCEVHMKPWGHRRRRGAA
jgi:hypothetical protein